MREGKAIVKIKQLFQKLFLYQPPAYDPRFRLQETPEEDPENAEPKELFALEPLTEPAPMTSVSTDLQFNLDFIKKTYGAPDNSDLVIRQFEIDAGDRRVKAFTVFFDGMSDSNQINEAIISPLLKNHYHSSDPPDPIDKIVGSMLVEQCTLKDLIYLEEVVDAINFGNCALFADGSEYAFVADVKNWAKRSVGPPQNEAVLRGPQEAFVESIRTNTALLRKSVKDANMMIENIPIGRRSKTPCALVYIKDIANGALVKEVRKRMKGLDIDYLFDSGELEQLIEDDTYSLFPQMVATERVDKACMALTSGRVVVIVNGTPYVLIVPSVISDYVNVTEDSFVRTPYSILFKVVRVIAILISLLLPGMYMAVVYFHQEMIPADLLFAIEASREMMPFPSIFELILMEIVFELIREAGIRMPTAVGPTLGIVGGLILGQAAVEAGIVSPIMIIVVALTGIGTFAVANYSLEFALRVSRFGYIILGSAFGFIGIAVGLFLQLLSLCSSYSFGVPLLSPIAPRMKYSANDLFSRAMWKREHLPDYLNTKKKLSQAKLSRKWTKK